MPVNTRQFDHEMLKEVFEQPEFIGQLVRKHVDFLRGTAFFAEFEKKMRDLRKVNRFTFLGCGTSSHAALFGNYIFEDLVDMPCEFELADEFNKRDLVLEHQTAVVILSQSGETGDALKAARLAKEKGGFVIAITNNPDSQLAGLSHVSIDLGVGKEKALAATKTFTSELVALAILALFIGSINRKPPTISKPAIAALKDIPDKITKILEQEESIKNLALKYKDIKGLVALGDRYHYPIALEAGLKLKETTYIHAEGFATGEFKHGPLAILDKQFPCLIFAPLNKTYENNKKIIEDVKKIGSPLIAITDEDNHDLDGLADDIIYIPKTLEQLNPVLSIIPIHIFAYYLALEKNIDVDKPRNLSKYVK